MPYFTSEFNRFFKELAANNNKEWFDENRKTYEQEVKKPFKNLVEDLINEISSYDKIDPEAKNAIFRINNDIRFSKEKIPYKMHVGANFSKGGRKDFNSPAFYVHLSPGESFIAAGIYNPDKDTLQKIRTGIAKNSKKLDSLRKEPQFVEYYTDFAPSKMNKILPKELKPLAEKIPLLYNKQYFYTHNFESGEELVLREDLKDFIMEFYQVARPMNQFLGEISS